MKKQFGLQEVNGIKVLQLETAAGAAIKVHINAFLML